MTQETLIFCFVEEALNWIGVKYRHRGMTKNGCDCTGMIIGMLRSLGFMKDYALRMYPIDWNLNSGAGNYIMEELGKVSYEIPKQSAAAGDILVFRFGKCMAHVGVMIDPANGKFVHALLTSKKCCFAILKNSVWSKSWEKTFRLDADKLGRLSG